MITMVTVWDVCCCKLLHMKVHHKDFMLLCHLPYSVQTFRIHDEYEYDMSIQYLPNQGQLLHLRSTNKIECFVYLVAMENKIIGFLKMF